MKRDAFTLIELLVVISIISLLMGILLPALGNVRRQGRAIVCLSNLRQMTIAANIYISENNGCYPLAFFMDFLDTSHTYEWDYFKTFENGRIKECKPGFLWYGKNISGIHQCPSYKGTANSPGDPYTGYNYNASYIGGSKVKIGNDIIGSDSAKAINVRKPSSCAVFGDGQFESGANKFMRSPQAGKLDENFPDAYRYAGTQGYRHEGNATNVAYADGSARTVRKICTSELHKKRIEDHNKINDVKLGFLSPDNSAYDLK